jgi:alpha-tubulin suppressor-like RCC1 family protein
LQKKRKTETKKEETKTMKKRMITVLALTMTVGVLIIGNLAMVASRAEDSTTARDAPISAWGNNFFGQLGNDTYTSSNTPVQVGNLGRGVESISAGGSHGLALKDDGTVWAWGYNEFGQLSDGTNTDSSTPVQVSELGGVQAITAGNAHNLVLNAPGTVWAWGLTHTANWAMGPTP